MQRQRIDETLIWQLMRFPDEPEQRSFGPTNGPTRAVRQLDALALTRR